MKNKKLPVPTTKRHSGHYMDTRDSVKSINMAHPTPLFCTCTRVLADKNYDRFGTLARSLFFTCAYVIKDQICLIPYFAHVYIQNNIGKGKVPAATKIKFR